MKNASDFHIPFAWDDRRPIIWEKCLYVPSNYLKHGDFRFDWNDPLLFSKEQPLAVEYCSGNGEWIAERARERPEINWVAVERDFDRARKIWLRIFRDGLSNLCLVFGEALVFSSHYLFDASVCEAYVNFPDPWPRRRHAKHRLIQGDFVGQLHRILKPGTGVWIATDDVAYSEQAIECFLKSGRWESPYAPLHYISELPEFGVSYFQDLWTKKNRSIRYHRFIHA